MDDAIDPTGFIRYLAAIGGMDRHECFDDAGEPDPIAARALAQGLRVRAGSELGGRIVVEQVANRVTVQLVRRQPVGV